MTLSEENYVEILTNFIKWSARHPSVYLMAGFEVRTHGDGAGGGDVPLAFLRLANWKHDCRIPNYVACDFADIS